MDGLLKPRYSKRESGVLCSVLPVIHKSSTAPIMLPLIFAIGNNEVF
jgi:hypothetical protein